VEDNRSKTGRLKFPFICFYLSPNPPKTLQIGFFLNHQIPHNTQKADECLG
jgi:hypothetical protein